MNILFISALMPYPLYSGGQVRIYNLLSRLSRTHDITLVTFLRDNQEKLYEKNLRFCKKIITWYRGHAWQPGYVARSVVGFTPLLLTSYDHAGLREEVAAELSRGQYDLVHIEPWYVWPSVPVTAIPVIAATHNIEYGVYAQYARTLRFMPIRPFYYWDVVKLRLWEERIWKRASRVVAVSPQDARVIQETIGSPTSVSIVPNGVDISSFRFAVKKNIDAPVFLFVGSFTWVQNQDAVRWLVTSIWPKLKDTHQGSQLRIVGRGMPAAIRKLVTNHRVTIHEHVEDIEKELHEADLLLAPIRIGGGTSFKILEAMASGLPVVTTTLGATGLKVADGKELMIGDTQDQFVRVVESLLASPKKRQEIARSARRIIEREYTWDSIAKTMDRLWYETATKQA